MENVAVVHYGEIGIKGKNREFFERKLIEAIKRASVRARRKYGRIEVEYREGLESRLSKIPGIRYFGVGFKTDLDLESIEKAALKVLPDSFETFKVDTSRSNKSFPMNSVEVNRKVGAFIVENTGKKVDLTNPDVTVWIEICEKEAYVYSKRYEA